MPGTLLIAGPPSEKFAIQSYTAHQTGLEPTVSVAVLSEEVGRLGIGRAEKEV